MNIPVQIWGHRGAQRRFRGILSVVEDLLETVRWWRLWTCLAWQDVQLKYRRSVLGPWWITLSSAIFIFAMSIVYTRLFHQDFRSYSVFFTTGYLIWTFIATVVNDSNEVFYSSRGIIKEIRLPFCLHLFRMIYRNLIVFSHNLLIIALVFLFARMELSWKQLLFFPGLVFVLLNLFWVSLFISLLSTRFRDIPPIVNSLMQILFMVSPITWMPQVLEGKSRILFLANPVYYLMDCIRSPLVGQMPDGNSYLVVGAMTVLGLAGALTLFSRCRGSIAFWVG